MGNNQMDAYAQSQVKAFFVFGHKSNGNSIVREVMARNTADAIGKARTEYPDCRFSHANLKSVYPW